MTISENPTAVVTTATTRTIADALATAARLHVGAVTEAYVSASSPEWAELYVHLDNGAVVLRDGRPGRHGLATGSNLPSFDTQA